MAREKMFPISAIISELRRHCENSSMAWEMIGQERDPRRKEMLNTGWQSENTSIGTLCDLLEITTVPDEERSAVIAVVSELAAMKGSHLVLGGLLESLKRP